MLVVEKVEQLASFKVRGVSNRAVLPLHTEGGDKTRLSENCVELMIASLDSVLYHCTSELGLLFCFNVYSLLIRYNKVSLLASKVPWRTLHPWWKLSRFFKVKNIINIFFSLTLASLQTFWFTFGFQVMGLCVNQDNGFDQSICVGLYVNMLTV